MSTADQPDGAAPADRLALPLRTARTLVLVGGLALFVAAFLALRLLRQEGADLPASVVEDSAPAVPTPAEPVISDAGSPALPTEPDDPAQPENEPDLPAVVDFEAALVEADLALAEGRLIGRDPPGALRLYRAALQVRPGDERAAEGLEAASSAALERAESTLEAGDLSAAEALVAELRRTAADDPRLAPIADAVTTTRRREQLANNGTLAVADDRLIEPPNDNALHYFQNLRDLDPNSEIAREGLRRVQRGVVERALDRARDGEFEPAVDLLGRVRRVWDNDDLVREAETQIAQLRSRRAQRLASQARDAMAQGEFDRARSLIDALAEIAPSGDFAGRLEDELANARLYSIYRPGDVFFDSRLTGEGTGPAMVVIPVGDFRMGSSSREDGRSNSEGPRHTVRFVTGFALARTEITVGQFRAFILATGYETDARREGYSHIYADSTGRVTRRKGITWRNDFAGHDALDSHPVLHVSWHDASAYAAWLAEATGLPYRLPSEAEFEYAIRGGTETPYWWGDGSPASPVTNLAGEGDITRRRRTWDEPFADYSDGYWGPAPVGSFVTNPFGLYDLGGNVAEWVEDCWHGSYTRAPRDGRAWVNVGCDRRVVRGGFWGSSPKRSRSAFRLAGSPDQRGPHLGFRVARSLVFERS